MDEFIKAMSEMLGIPPEQIFALDLTPQVPQEPTSEQIADEAFRAMYPHFPTGRTCQDAGCDCGGQNVEMASSALN